MYINMFHTQRPENFDSDMDVVGCYLTQNEKLLLLLRHELKIEPNTWCVPGGKVDEGETLVAAAVRELKEETGIIADESELHYFTTIYKTNPTFNLLFHIFSLQKNERPEVTLNPTEHVQYRWATLEEALTLPLIPDEDLCIKMLYNI